ncbi:hypothetical protein [Sinimarinibacterium sp. CAU 1509]|uniref:hypothetical protein n=1 Tax=Sinimarinibacterium sp. CAU 1509 TaxID=2562283 RepID=UPI00146B6B0C|nr:hypothetical protein [Sinimarinibacterium sp. CAU 1509]
MHRYARAWISGGTFFFTVAPLERRTHVPNENIHQPPTAIDALAHPTLSKDECTT